MSGKPVSYEELIRTYLACDHPTCGPEFFYCTLDVLIYMYDLAEPKNREDITAFIDTCATANLPGDTPVMVTLETVSLL